MCIIVGRWASVFHVPLLLLLCMRVRFQPFKFIQLFSIRMSFVVVVVVAVDGIVFKIERELYTRSDVLHIEN